MLGFKPGFAYLGLAAERSSAAARDAARPRPGRIGGARRAPDRGLPGELAGRLAAHRPDLAARSSTPGANSRRSSRPATAFASSPSRSCAARRRRSAAPRAATSSPHRARPRAGPAHDGAGRRPPRPSALGRGIRGSRRRHRLAAANRAVGNRADAAALECTVAGPLLEFLAPVHFAVAGADLGAVLERADLGDWPLPRGASILARPGNRLRFTGRRDGCRAYVALRGGIDVPPVLGSRSTDLASGFGGLDGRALRADDRIAVLPASGGESVRARARGAGRLGPRARGARTAAAALRCRHRRALPRGRAGASPRPPTASGSASRASRSATTARPRSSPTAWSPDRSRSRRTAGRS